MDAFFASVEQRDQPELRGKPVVVGGSSRRGVIAAASYEAREYGVRSAMPSVTAIQKCPQLIFVKGRYEVYKEVSQEIRAIFHEYTDLVEPLSLDEAYLDVTQNKAGNPSATLIAKDIKQKIKARLDLTASAGVSFNKFLAKVASGYQKPDGLTVIKPDQAMDFIAQLPIGKFHGVGKKTAAKMVSMGIHTGADLQACTLPQLAERFGKMGKYYYHISRAEDNREVIPSRERKSIGAERTFFNDLVSEVEVEEELEKIAQILAGRMAKAQAKGRTFTLKYRFSDFKTFTRSITKAAPLFEVGQLTDLAISVFRTEQLEDFQIRLLGMSVSNLDQRLPKEGVQLKLFN
jgi:DNA polymerase-4